MIVYVDCDTGIDDALALALLLAHDDVRIAGIGTVNGNTTAAQAAANTLALLRLAGRTGIPVAVGAGGYRGGAAHVHGGNGIGGVDLPAATQEPDPRTASRLLADLARAHPGELQILAIGPLTNLADALADDPELPARIAGVTVMAGAVRVPGNVSAHGEANIADDPAAAAAVLAAAWPVTLVPLDVTMNHRAGEPDRRALAAGTPLHRALAAMLPAYFDSYEPRLGERRIPLHDPLAAAVLTGDVVPLDAPLLGLRVDVENAHVVEDPGAATRTRVVFTVDRPAAPVVLSRILAA